MADNFTVTSQRQTQQLTPDGRFVDVIEVNFQIPSGNTGTVSIPVANYAPDYVKQVIEERANKMIAVEQL